MTSNSSQHTFAIVPEVVFGTTPANPAFKKKGITGTSLALAKGTVESETIRPDRQVADFRHTTRQVGGELNFELNADGFHDLFEALLCGTWASVGGKQTLTSGVTRRSFSVLRKFGDQLQADSPFHRYTGVCVNTLKLTVKPDELVKCSLGLFGQNVVLEETAPAGIAWTEPSAKKAFDAFTASLNLAGSELATATELSLSVENGMDTRFVIGDDKTLEPKIGKCRVSGSVTVHFANKTILAKFFAAEEVELSFQLLDADGNGYTVTLPRVLLNGGQPDVEGDADILLTIPFQAMANADNVTIKLEQETA